jgi:hypothetical protein
MGITSRLAILSILFSTLAIQGQPGLRKHAAKNPAIDLINYKTRVNEY